MRIKTALDPGESFALCPSLNCWRRNRRNYCDPRTTSEQGRHLLLHGFPCSHDKASLSRELQEHGKKLIFLGRNARTYTAHVDSPILKCCSLLVQKICRCRIQKSDDVHLGISRLGTGARRRAWKISEIAAAFPIIAARRIFNFQLHFRSPTSDSDDAVSRQAGTPAQLGSKPFEVGLSCGESRCQYASLFEARTQSFCGTADTGPYPAES